MNQVGADFLVAMKCLVKCADGLSFREAEIRAVVGNTNWNVLRHWIEEASAAIAQAEALSPPAGNGGMSIPICCVTGLIAGDADACGDCDPCLADYCVPDVVKRLLAEKEDWRQKYGEAKAEALSPPVDIDGASPDEAAGIAWWNAMTEPDRAEWMRRAGSTRPADAWAAYKAALHEPSPPADMEKAPLLTRAIEMRRAIDALEGALMGYGDLVDLPQLFRGAGEAVMLAPKVTVGQMRRVCEALAECTRIINSEEYTERALTTSPHVSVPADMEKAIEAAAKAMCAAQDLDWDAQSNAMTSASGSDQEQEGYRDMARAALEAALPFLTASPHAVERPIEAERLACRIERHIADCAAYEGHVFDLRPDEQRMVVAALRGQPHAVEREWQDISTAPKDGTRILSVRTAKTLK